MFKKLILQWLPWQSAWRHRVSAWTGWPGASILWQGETASWISNFYLSVWQQVQSSEQIRPWDTLVCCWGFKQPTNNFFFVVLQPEMPIALTKTTVLVISSRLPQNWSLSGIGSGTMSRLTASCSWQCCSWCSAVITSALQRAHLRLTRFELAVHVTTQTATTTTTTTTYNNNNNSNKSLSGDRLVRAGDRGITPRSTWSNHPCH